MAMKVMCELCHQSALLQNYILSPLSALYSILNKQNSKHLEKEKLLISSYVVTAVKQLHSSSDRLAGVSAQSDQSSFINIILEKINDSGSS